MNIKELTNDQRKIVINIKELYLNILDLNEEIDKYSGGMSWKKQNGREYLVRIKGRNGNMKSLGIRSLETENIFSGFHSEKLRLKERSNSFKKELLRQSKIALANGLGRMPTISANIVRLLEKENLLGSAINILGTNAIYAYEAAAGVEVGDELMATMDIDLLYNANSKLKLSSDFSSIGLIGLINKVDKSFSVASKGHYRAINNKGFMVELIKMSPTPPFKKESQKLSNVKGDLTAVEMDEMKWLNNAPKFSAIIIAEDGLPAKVTVPDPRFFALNKLLVSQDEKRDPHKRPRDYGQAKVVANIAVNYLNLSFDDEVMNVFPASAREQIASLISDEDNSKPSSLSALF